jgi:hypothetical protein
MSSEEINPLCEDYLSEMVDYIRKAKEYRLGQGKSDAYVTLPASTTQEQKEEILTQCWAEGIHCRMHSASRVLVWWSAEEVCQ